ncbi:hypothetical protein PHYBOEH_001768 [Phytophthora boehmeriae]|uniref:Uncharacterized protein n=1 Tax=Phytophthora boehmeriae TaxID=109152 RepID=A0A8T1X588_9STRA|nr:hypothetical protein PHYBOEH_001768 [Phytophthora boehmeriae]
MFDYAFTSNHNIADLKQHKLLVYKPPLGVSDGVKKRDRAAFPLSEREALQLRIETETRSPPTSGGYGHVTVNKHDMSETDLGDRVNIEEEPGDLGSYGVVDMMWYAELDYTAAREAESELFYEASLKGMTFPFYNALE